MPAGSAPHPFFAPLRCRFAPTGQKKALCFLYCVVFSPRHICSLRLILLLWCSTFGLQPLPGFNLPQGTLRLLRGFRVTPVLRGASVTPRLLAPAKKVPTSRFRCLWGPFLPKIRYSFFFRFQSQLFSLPLRFWFVFPTAIFQCSRDGFPPRGPMLVFALLALAWVKPGPCFVVFWLSSPPFGSSVTVFYRRFLSSPLSLVFRYCFPTLPLAFHLPRAGLPRL